MRKDCSVCSGFFFFSFFFLKIQGWWAKLGVPTSQMHDTTMKVFSPLALTITILKWFTIFSLIFVHLIIFSSSAHTFSSNYSWRNVLTFHSWLEVAKEFLGVPNFHSKLHGDDQILIIRRPLVWPKFCDRQFGDEWGRIGISFFYLNQNVIS